ncbi:MAG: hypothetical protein JO295_15060 [Verrucomicrobia bacterium]|nr:hypothetical protein [Verrucomicrobiota bacterium]
MNTTTASPKPPPHSQTRNAQPAAANIGTIIVEARSSEIMLGNSQVVAREDLSQFVILPARAAETADD